MLDRAHAGDDPPTDTVPATTPEGEPVQTGPTLTARDGQVRRGLR